MKNEELIEKWILLPSERVLILSKRGPSKLGFGILLKFFQATGRFPLHRKEISADEIQYVAGQLKVSATLWSDYDWSGRSIKYHRSKIRELLGFREATVEDCNDLVIWLCEQVLPSICNSQYIEEAAYQRFRELRIEPPTPDRVGRFIKSAVHSFETRFYGCILQRLSETTQNQLNDLLLPDKDNDDQGKESDSGYTILQELRSDPGRANLDSLLKEISKLDRIRAIDIPSDLFDGLSPRVLQSYKRRVAIEEPYELRRHSVPLRVTLLAVFCHFRSRELTDNLTDLLIELIHRIGAKAERKSEKELVEDVKRVRGKTNLLFQLAEVSINQPNGIIKDVLFPVVGEKTLQDLVKEWKSSGNLYRLHVQTIIRSSYRYHYRRMMPRLLSTLEFCSNNEKYRPIIQALEILKKYANSSIRTYPLDETIPTAGIVSGLWEDVVITKDKAGKDRINRINYEVCVLQVLRERLRCKEIWVVGADRFRNPDDDLPKDFNIKRNDYYAALNLPLSAEEFIEKLKKEMTEELAAFDRDLPNNSDVKILKKANGWIKLSQLAPDPEPNHLIELKTEIAKLWPMTSLLDILKETDLRVGFTECFRSPTPWENLDRKTLQYRILLCLYGLGTNAGLKRVNAGHKGVTYKELLYTRKRFITKEYLRDAIIEIVNKTFQIRRSHIWGEGTTACASDSKKFGAWDQNLMTEWHARYKGRGVMIYWHVDRKSACIHSQLKTCSSSEVAAMIHGVLRHCTEMSVDRQYVDSHGQNDVAFAFCNLLSFLLLPRLKGIHSKKLYRPEAGKTDAFPNLQLILSRPIGEKIRK